MLFIRLDYYLMKLVIAYNLFQTEQAGNKTRSLSDQKVMK